MPVAMSSRLVLGAAQFGMAYGVVGSGYAADGAEIDKILSECRRVGIDRVDTAIAYGHSEFALGERGIGDFRVTSKLPPVPVGTTDPYLWARVQVTEALQRLRVKNLDILLLHHPSDVLSHNGPALVRACEEMRSEGLIRKTGISIYEPTEISSVISIFPVEVVQSPMNVLDQRLAQSGWLDVLQVSGVEVFVRSVFLQGLLLTSTGRLPTKFLRWSKLWNEWWHYVAETGRSAMDLCLSAVLRHDSISGVIVGCETRDQLSTITESANRQGPVEYPQFFDVSEDLIDPRKWDKS
jgi:aryl-alcohol dehydrogenase-like predicted oxidoreductase